MTLSFRQWVYKTHHIRLRCVNPGNEYHPPYHVPATKEDELAMALAGQTLTMFKLDYRVYQYEQHDNTNTIQP